jgi:putative FmdB family regulatory protein
MPIYEFRCEECGARFERLVGAGTEAVPCPDCGSTGTVRVYSAQAAPFQLAKTPGEARKQERRNAALKDATKARFKEARARQRAARRQRDQ